MRLFWLYSTLDWNAESSDSEVRLYAVGLNLYEAQEKLRHFIFARR